MMTPSKYNWENRILPPLGAPTSAIRPGSTVAVLSEDLARPEWRAIAGDTESGGRVWVYRVWNDEWYLLPAERVWAVV
jgi:hypothetical protein